MGGGKPVIKVAGKLPRYGDVEGRVVPGSCAASGWPEVLWAGLPVVQRSRHDVRVFELSHRIEYCSIVTCV